MKKIFLCLLFFSCKIILAQQPTFPVNGVTDVRSKCYAFTHATVYTDYKTKLENATLVIKNGKVISVTANGTVPKDAVEVDCKGKFIYPGLIDIYTDYGLPANTRQPSPYNFYAAAQLTSNQKGAYGWNQAIRTDVNAVNIFSIDDNRAKQLRELGFTTVLTHNKDGIARGTGAVVTLTSNNDNLAVIKDKASAHYSFSKGLSTQSYPNSMMGYIALLRQTYLDAQWYKKNADKEGLNLSLQNFNDQQSLPQIFEANDKWNDLRADRIGKEFGVQYIIKAGGNEYQRIDEIKATKASYIVPLNFPQAMDVEDANDARYVSLADMKHWEMAPSNPAAFEKAGINFCLTTSDLRTTKEFTAALKKAIEYGLTEQKALEALTKTPAVLLGIDDKTGSLEKDKLANFIIVSAPLFSDKATILQNWIQGEKYNIADNAWSSINGFYKLKINKSATDSALYRIEVKGNNSANILSRDTITAKFNYDNNIINLSFGDSKKAKELIRLSGVNAGNVWQGTGLDTAGNRITWSASFDTNESARKDSVKKRQPVTLGKVTYPFLSYGWETKPVQKDYVIKNVTAWTNEKEGIIKNATVVVSKGKIVSISDKAYSGNAEVIDGTGLHLTAGIIDEHSHIATSSINEGGQSVTSEVRIGDNLNPDDVNIYRQLSGGVTTSHILHGSANTIGGQTQLIKMRWGANDEQLKFEGADGFIKFALGENVKRTPAQSNNRFPDTRMGVEQVLMDAFTRASDYQKAMKANAAATRRDLELDALVEIMNKKRFITCHSYKQSEIVMEMRVAEKFGYTVNTFTHILEGYKVADKMKKHGSNASTFSDWWYYKMEVEDAIAYNAAIMQKFGLNVAINSDDAEMARRLNQEAAKSIKYGGMSEEDALKMVTLNPAKMLHIDNRVGSIKAGKDADLVLWSDNPLSIYAKPLKTMVDGIIYFDREEDTKLQQKIKTERIRLINKMIGEKKGGAAVVPARATTEHVHRCLLDDIHDDEFSN